MDDEEGHKFHTACYMSEHQQGSKSEASGGPHERRQENS